ncbi:Stp1/IreP family PP2C-type Ser/Thr phosphatase [uncultured Desulfuromusa sp.]|uniref:Stp1/IreP family PP2C-type Ser/Thr phosphatase n=1 Tax=uncultured Desulfuromusa sp. TaxID=219183 RepID=UPI002AA6272D|nr:Stp1/IreP family PP2C-type Ser/Thr phosphatase [uncultured Desulfuromusa sp.]
MKLQVCAKTDIGLTRKNNEDSLYVDKEQGLFIIADGMGGHAAGEIASRIAVDTVRQALQTIDRANILEQLKHAIEKANRDVVKAANNNNSWKGMGTTLTVLLLDQQHGFLAHVGDSRAYCLDDDQLRQLSDDHSLVAEQLRRELISIEDAKNSGIGGILLQAVGVSSTLDICLKHIPLVAGEYFLLCSDGLSNMLTDAEIEHILKEAENLNSCCDQLIDAAIVAGGKDNITVIVVKIDKI